MMGFEENISSHCQHGYQTLFKRDLIRAFWIYLSLPPILVNVHFIVYHVKTETFAKEQLSTLQKSHRDEVSRLYKAGGTRY